MIIIPFWLILSILPSAVILFYIYRRDKYEQEPLSLLLKSFGLGVLSAIAVILLFMVLKLFIPTEPNTGNHIADAFISAFFLAAVPEELFKFLMLYLLIWKNPNFDERFDGIIYSVFVSLGFATLENILYVLQSGVGVAIARALTAVPAHALFGVAMGFYFSYAKFLPEYKNKYLGLCIGIPVVLHGIYDFLIFAEQKFLFLHPEISILLFLIFIGFVIFLWVQGFKKIKKMSSDFYFTGIPLNEVREYINQQQEYINQQQVEIPVSYLRNWYEITPILYEREKTAIIEKYPDATINIDDGIVMVSLNVSNKFQWIIQLVYARNYRKLREQLRIYILQPNLNELVAIDSEIPYVKADLSNNYYLDVAPQEQPSGPAAIDNALRWANLFEKWVNEEIELNEFIIN
jgi:RsiW-degrading membrane proteinase PrsW (M82 family)